MDAARLSLGFAQCVALGVGLVGVALYAGRVESKAADAYTRVLEMRTEIKDIREEMHRQRATLATVQADSRFIRKTLEQLERRND